MKYLNLTKVLLSKKYQIKNDDLRKSFQGNYFQNGLYDMVELAQFSIPYANKNPDKEPAIILMIFFLPTQTLKKQLL